MEETTIELRDDEIQELIATPPTWLVRWGTTLFFGLMVLVGIGAWLIEYPDIIRVPGQLVSATTPKAIVARTAGKLARLFITDNQAVTANEVVGYMESTADYGQVLALENQLRTGASVGAAYNRLGEIQPAYQVYAQARIQYLAFQQHGFYAKKRGLLQKDLADLQQLAQNSIEQQTIEEADLQLVDNEYATQKKLYDQRVISSLDLKQNESKLLHKRLLLKQLNSTLINNSTAQTAKQKEMMELDRLVSEQETLYQQARNTLSSAIDAWKLQFLLVSPVAGRVAFPSLIQEKQVLALHQEVCTVGTTGAAYHVLLHIGQRNFGKVKSGQRVLLKFNSYPFQEFGAVEGRITHISEVPARDSTFLAEVALPNGLRTKFKKTLRPKEGMNAQADIITEDLRLLERLFYDIRRAISR